MKSAFFNCPGGGAMRPDTGEPPSLSAETTGAFTFPFPLCPLLCVSFDLLTGYLKISTTATLKPGNKSSAATDSPAREERNPNLQILFNLSNNLADLERASFHLRERNCVHQVLRA